jgi:hypothetical protein
MLILPWDTRLPMEADAIALRVAESQVGINYQVGFG